MTKAKSSLTFDDILKKENTEGEAALEALFSELQSRYKLDFAGHLEEIYHGATLHRTVEYIRRHR